MLARPISTVAKRVSSGLTPLRSNLEFWQNGTIQWLKTEQLGEKFIYSTTEKISETALRKTKIKVYPPNTLSIAMYGEGKTRGNVSIIKSEMATNQACCNVELDPDLVDYEYVYYFLKTQYNELRNLSSGVRKNLNSDDIKNFVIRLPEALSEQKKIADVLAALDAKIECNARINAELEGMAKALYDYWFLQFDFPNKKGRPYKSSDGKMVFNLILNREIPAEWEIHKIGEVLEVVLGGTPSTLNADYWENGTINWLNSGEMNAFPVVLAASKITKKALDNSATKLMPSGSVAISITRYIRPTILAIDSCANQSVVGVYESSTFKNSYLYPFFVNEVSRYMTIRTGAMQPHINKETIKETLIIKPPSQILSKYYEIVNPIYLKIINNAKENLELIQLRDWLLPLLMNGQVNVNKYTK